LGFHHSRYPIALSLSRIFFTRPLSVSGPAIRD
jgi:hypothetical protein